MCIYKRDLNICKSDLCVNLSEAVGIRSMGKYTLVSFGLIPVSCVLHSAQNGVRKRPELIQKRPMCTYKRDLNIRKRDLCVDLSETAGIQSPEWVETKETYVYIQKRPMCIYKRDLNIRKRKETDV